MIFDATIRNINLEEFRLPQTIYIVLRYYEELTDFIAYKENLEYKGHRRVLESCRVELSQTEPDIMREVELARIYLEKGVQRVRDARDPADPKPNEIDMRYTPKGGLVGLDAAAAPAAPPRDAALAGAARRARVHAARRDRGARRRAGLQHGADAALREPARPAEHLRHLQARSSTPRASWRSTSTSTTRRSRRRRSSPSTAARSRSFAACSPRTRTTWTRT